MMYWLSIYALIAIFVFTAFFALYAIAVAMWFTGRGLRLVLLRLKEVPVLRPHLPHHWHFTRPR
jgi:hypothetical protein